MLINKISHEMGNAVTIVKCSLNILKTQYPQIGETKYFGTVLGEIGYMENLLKDISDYKSINSYNMKNNDIYALAENVVESVRDIYADKGIYIKINCENVNENYIINCDATKMIQTFINLIKNAAEAIGEMGFIEINMRKNNDFVEIDITDNGSGIEEEYIESIFEPMITYKTGGTGMGLAIVKEIINGHGGIIKVVSAVDAGTTFTLKLPVNYL